MELTNYHTHNDLCDGQGRIKEYVETALAKGFKALGFSSHAPLPWDNDWSLDCKRLGIYLDTVQQIKKDYDGRIEVYLGLEVDFLAGTMHARDKWIEDLNLEYVIGSVHSLPSDPDGHKWLSVDGPDQEFIDLLNNRFKGSIPALVGEYYHQVREMIRIGRFDILGHLDLVKKKNARLCYLEEKEAWYQNEIKRTLSVLGGTGIIMEVNTGGIARGHLTEPYPSEWILKLAAESNIPIQLNSDAHDPQQLDCQFPETKKLLKACGFSSVRVLLQGTWQDTPL